MKTFALAFLALGLTCLYVYTGESQFGVVGGMAVVATYYSAFRSD